MPASVWWALWQWTIHLPGLSAMKSTSTDPIGGARTVSLRDPRCPDIAARWIEQFACYVGVFGSVARIIPTRL